MQFIEELPKDLNTSKVIFLRYDSVTVDAKDKTAKYYQQKHNRNVPAANKELAEAAKKYPFEYTIASRKNLDNLKSKGYKYVMDSEAFQNMSVGFRQDYNIISYGETRTKTAVSYHYKLYFKDMEKNVAYIISEKLTENQLYFPKYVMNKFVISKVKKQYK